MVAVVTRSQVPRISPARCPGSDAQTGFLICGHSDDRSFIKTSLILWNFGINRSPITLVMPVITGSSVTSVDSVRGGKVLSIPGIFENIISEYQRSGAGQSQSRTVTDWYRLAYGGETI